MRLEAYVEENGDYLVLGSHRIDSTIEGSYFYVRDGRFIADHMKNDGGWEQIALPIKGTSSFGVVTLAAGAQQKVLDLGSNVMVACTLSGGYCAAVNAVQVEDGAVWLYNTFPNTVSVSGVASYV